MKIIFLDVDGVLVTARHKRLRPGFRRCRDLTRTGCGYAEFDPECVANLNRICESARALIVVSSTWREFFGSLDTMRSMFREQGVTGTIIGRTPINHSIDSLRGGEIAEWLDENEESIETCVILDDEDHEWDDCCRGRWIHTDFDVGLTAEDADRAIGMLATVSTPA